MRYIKILLFLFFIPTIAKNPSIKKVNYVDKKFGIEISDPFKYLENKKSKNLKDFLNKEKEYLNKKISKMKEINKFKNLSLKNEDKDYISKDYLYTYTNRVFYYKRNKTYPKGAIFYKENNRVHEVLNYSHGFENKMVYEWKISENGKYLAYSLSSNGSEDTKIILKDIDNNITFKEVIYGRFSHGIVWLPDSKGFLYSASPENKSLYYLEYCSIYYYNIKNKKSYLIYTNKDKELYHYAEVCPVGSKIFIYSWKADDQINVYIKDIKDLLNKKIINFITGFKGAYSIKEFKNNFYILEINKKNPNGKVYITKDNKLEKSNWKEIINKNDRFIHDIYIFNKKLFVKYLKNASEFLDIYNLKGNFIKNIDFPYLCTFKIFGKPTKDIITIETSTFIDSKSRYLFSKNKNNLVYRKKSILKHNAEDFNVKQVWFKSKDGTKVSMFIIYLKKINLNGNTPLLLEAYGAFNESQLPRYYKETALWADNGGIACIPNTRGGGEYGLNWYLDGRALKKQNAIDDVISATEYIIKNKYSNPNKIAIWGLSAGGIVVGGAIIQRPELYKTAYLLNPLLDLIYFKNFGNGKQLTEEYGNPDIRRDFEILYKISPYQNIKKKGKYPSIIISSSKNDDRVGYEQGIKFIAKLQSYNKNNLALLLFNANTSHASFSKKTKYIPWGFLWNQVQLK